MEKRNELTESCLSTAQGFTSELTKTLALARLMKDLNAQELPKNTR